MQVRDVMSRNPEGVDASDSVFKAATVMDRLNVGVLPVMQDSRDVGVVTDRDIVVRCIANELNPKHTSVGEIMSKGAYACQEDDDIATAVSEMRNRRIRRLLVKDTAGRVTGIVSLGDIATEAPSVLSGEALHTISEPSHPER
jgi:CBS domain-containing protein